MFRHCCRLQLFGRLSRECCPSGLHSRQIYTPSSLGLDRFAESRQRSSTQFEKMKDRFFKRLEATISSQGTSAQDMVFTEDLKNAIYLTQTEDELILLLKLIKKYNSQNADLRFTNFHFGPVVMRLLHCLNKPETAVKLIESPENVDFFKESMSYILASDILFRNGKYQDVLNIYDQCLQQSSTELKYARDLVVYVLAACLKLKTPESYAYALTLMQKVREVHKNMPIRGVAIFASLALEEGDNQNALEALSMYPNNHVSVRNLRIVTLIRLNRMEHGLSLLRSILNDDRPKLVDKTPIFSDTLPKVREVVEKSHDSETFREYEQIERALLENKLVSQQTFEEYIFEEQDLPSKRTLLANEPPTNGRFRSGYTRRPPPRVGLVDAL